MIALTIETWIRWGNATSVRSGNVAMMLLKSEGKICPWHGAKTSLRKGTTIALTIERCLFSLDKCDQFSFRECGHDAFGN